MRRCIPQSSDAGSGARSDPPASAACGGHREGARSVRCGGAPAVLAAGRYRSPCRQSLAPAFDEAAPVGSATFRATFKSLAKAGRLVFVGEVSGQQAQFDPALVIYKETIITGAQSANSEELEQVLALVAAGRFNPVISLILPLEDAAQSHQMLSDRQQFGRTVPRVS